MSTEGSAIMRGQRKSAKGPRAIVAASILGCDLGRVVEEALSAVEAGAEAIHADVMDGHFVPNISFGPDLIGRVVAAVEARVTAHLMVERPERLLDVFLDTRADRILVHPEATAHARRALDVIREGGASAGTALNPGTPLCFAEVLLPHVDEVLVMTVNPGWGGQQMMAEQLDKVRELRRRIDAGDLPAFDISVDGGIAPNTAGVVREAGATVLVAGTALFGALDRAEAIREMLT